MQPEQSRADRDQLAVGRGLGGQRYSRRSFLKGLAGSAAAVGAGPSFLVACASQGKQQADLSAQGPLKIATIQPLTGPLVASFNPQFIGLNLAVNEINATGGILGRQIEIVKYDDQGNAAQEPLIAQRIAQDGHSIVFGPIGSTQTVASMAVLQKQAKPPIQFSSSSDPSTTDPTKNPGSFTCTQPTTFTNAVVVSYAAQQKGAKIGVLYEDTTFGQNSGPPVIDALKAKGITPVAVQTFPLNSSTMTAEVLQLYQSGVNLVLFFGSTAPDAIRMALAMLQLNYSPKIVGQTYLVTLVNSVPKGTTIPTSFLNNIRVPSYKNLLWRPGKQLPPQTHALVEAILNDSTTGPNKYTVVTNSYYDELHMLKKVIESSGSFDPVVMRKGLESAAPYNGADGAIKFSAKSHFGLTLDDIAMGVVTDLTAPESFGFLPMAEPGT